jgi:hypothetical protein
MVAVGRRDDGEKMAERAREIWAKVEATFAFSRLFRTMSRDASFSLPTGPLSALSLLDEEQPDFPSSQDIDEDATIHAAPQARTTPGPASARDNDKEPVVTPYSGSMGVLRDEEDGEPQEGDDGARWTEPDRTSSGLSSRELGLIEERDGLRRINVLLSQTVQGISGGLERLDVGSFP